MQNKQQVGFLMILVAAAFGTLAFVIWPTLYATNEKATSQQQQVVRDFYNWYLSYEANPLVDHAYRSSRYLSPNMITFLDEFTQNDMAYDPLLCAQDKPTKINISTERVSGGRARLTIRTDFESHEFTVELVQINGDWLIDKVRCEP